MLRVNHRPWDRPLDRPAMATTSPDARPDLGLTNRYLERHGRPVIPVSGEIHYSRVPRSRWAERLRLMVAGGVTVASTYVIWNHHVAERGRPDFTGGLDLGAFVDLCHRAGLDVVLRIGPWCHGEVRNGGFPDWVQPADVVHRTDDPAYLTLVREWFGQVARAVADRCGPDGPVIAIQLDNELYDQPGHLSTLKALAREAGLVAPLWTATAWGGAQLPEGEVLPLFGGYGDGFWVDADRPWDPTFRAHFLISHEWDDPGIGADLRTDGLDVSAPGAGVGAPRAGERTASPFFPAATCELGGGMATAYHRRPRPQALDVAALAHVKLASGSAWQGYYMYVGGTNPVGPGGADGPGLQETQATGYPNDLPRFDYDFHAPVGASGLPAPSHAGLRLQHAFLAAFGADLATMPSTLPDDLPAGVEDSTTLRWALRSDGRRGVLFCSWHQPHVPLPAYEGARFAVGLDHGTVELPAGPVTIPPGTLARWPVRWTTGGVRIEWATASLLTVLDDVPGRVPTLVLVAEAGVPTEVALTPDDVRPVEAGGPPLRVRTTDGALDVLVLAPQQARTAWVYEAASGEAASGESGPGVGASGARERAVLGRRLLLSAEPLTWGVDGRVEVRSAAAEPDVQVYDAVTGTFVGLPVRRVGSADSGGGGRADGGGAEGDGGPRTATVPLQRVRGGASVPTEYGRHDGRQSAPDRRALDALAAVETLDLPDWARRRAADVWLEIDWAGDVAELRIDGVPVADRYWDGSRWTLNLGDLGVTPTSAATLHVLPLAADTGVALPAAARERLIADAGPGRALGTVDAVQATERCTWVEV